MLRCAMADLLIRPARADELEALGGLQLRASLAWGDHVEALKAMPEASQLPAEHLPSTAVAELDGRVVGFVTVLPPQEGEAELDGLFVEPDGWRGGVGRRLVAEAERRARAAGAGAIHVIANGRALAFYRACGFEVVGEVMTRLEPAPEMRKALG